MDQDLKGKVVVITGASSGIGRAAARRFAERGARLVLAARRDQMLDDVVDECADRDAQAIAVPTDVTESAQVNHLANEAIRRFGAIDLWINNAGVMMFGALWQTPEADFRRLVDINLFGCVNGARAVLGHFVRRGRGILINNASIVGHVGQPLSSAYVASKWAVRGFTIALRQDLLDHPGVQVCMVSPSSIDTPLWQHAANYSGRAFRAYQPIYDPEQVANAMVALAVRPRREVVVGTMGQAMAVQHRVAPALAEWQMARSTLARVFLPAREHDHPGALFRPMEDGLRVHGGWRKERSRRPAALGAAVAAVPLALALLSGRPAAAHRA
jgi:short-subunit dehydrogenase